MQPTEADLTLSDGREVVFNFNNISIREWRSLFDIKQGDEEEYRIVGKLIGIEAEEAANLGYEDWVGIVKAMKAKVRELNTNPT